MPLEELAKSAKAHALGNENLKRPLEPFVNKNAAKQQSVKAYQDQNEQGDSIRVKTVSEIMSSPVKTLLKDTTFDQAWQQFIQHRYRHFPVINQEQQLVGMLSDRDLLTAAATHQLGPLKSHTIEKFMTHHVLTAAGETRILEVCRVMFHQHIGAIPITSEKAQVIGIVSRSDILRTIVEFGPLELWG